MTMTKKEQARYSALAEQEETPAGVSAPGVSAHGADAAAIGRQMLLEALGSADAVTKATGGRPRIGRADGLGESPTIRVRVSVDQKRDIHALRTRMKMKNDSDLVRAALDEYMSTHLHSPA